MSARAFNAILRGRTEPDEEETILLTPDMRVRFNPFEPYDWLWDLELRYAVKFIEWREVAIC